MVKQTKDKGDLYVSNLTYTDLLIQLGVSGAHPGGLSLTKAILAVEKISKITKILDIGCGTGETASFIKSHYNCDVTAIDLHSMMVEKAKERFNNKGQSINLQQANVEALPFESNSYDLIIAESVLAFTNPIRAVKEIARVAQKGGVFIAVEMTKDPSLSPIEQSEIEQFYGVNTLSEKEWDNLLSQHFTAVSIYDKEHFATNEATYPNQNQPSKNIDPSIFKILEQHNKLLMKYKDKLGYRIYHCVK